LERIHKDNVVDILPLTPLQSTLLISYLAEPDGNHYKEITRYRLDGSISTDMIEEAINAVVSENEMLRTVFRWKNLRQPVQIVLKEKSVPIQQYEVYQVEGQSQEAKVDELEQESFSKALDICENPIKFAIYKLKKDVYYVTIINHHILFDGWSNSILLGELYHALCQLVQNKPVSFKKKAGIRDYLGFLKKRDRAMDTFFWKEYLSGTSRRTVLPKIRHYPMKDKQEKLLTHREDSTVYKEVKAFSANLSVSAAAVFYAAWGLIYYQENRQSDVVFGIALDGRPPEVENINQTIGLFMNSVPLRITINEKETIKDFISQVNSSLINIREHQFISYSEIIAQSQIKPTGTLYDSVIVIQNYPVDTSMLIGEGSFVISLHSRKITTGAKLTIEIRTFGGFFIDVSYQEEYYNEETVRELVDQYKELLLCMIEKKERSLMEVINLGKKDDVWNMLQGGGDSYDDF
jgi:hypothetical protein